MLYVRVNLRHDLVLKFRPLKILCNVEYGELLLV